jgi:proteasome lid subunit RPN8/RPN11
MIQEILEHFKKEYPKEGCGVLVEKRYKIVGIVHSHPDLPCAASENDKKHCDFVGIPYYIFSYPSMDLEIVEPRKRVLNIIGRKYENFA